MNQKSKQTQSNPSTSKPKILALDIETAPHTAHVWGLFKENIQLDRLRETGRVLCFSYKWLNVTGPVKFVSEREGRGLMLDKIHELLTEADIVVTYNGKKFDIPTLNKDLFKAGYSPPAPFKHVDLYQVARRRFRFASNKMDHLAKELGLKTKIRHSGHGLWVSCMEGDEKAWLKMERYNKRDVLILDKLYEKMLPWIGSHPNVAVYGVSRPDWYLCPSCGSGKVQARGTVVARSLTYRRYHCQSCRAWSRSAVSVAVPKPKLVQVQ